ncbi:ATPase, T2SS/T4P/T4SS family [Thermodesulfobacteriota bacterium]
MPVSKEEQPKKTSLRLGDLLLKEGYVKKDDIEKALTLQKHEKEIQDLPIGQILIEINALSESDVGQVLNHPELRKNIGEYLIKSGIISREQLRSCLKKQSPDTLIGQIFISEGYLDPEDLEICLKEQMKAPRFGELALKLGLINEKDLEIALRIQKNPRKLGEILCDLRLINPLDLNYCLNKYHKRLDISDILLSKKIITHEQLQLALQELTYSSDTLGEILVRKRLISRENLISALSEQNNIVFKELRDFTYSEDEKKNLSRIISQKYAESKLILPISLKENNLILALFRTEELQNAVYELKGMYSNFNITCILITKEKYEELFEVLYSTHLSSSTSDNLDIPDEGTEIDFMELNIDEEIGGKNANVPAYGAKDIEAEELVNFILTYGIVNSASDIHIEQDRKGAKLRYRIDGILRGASIGWLRDRMRDKTPSIISRIKVMANLDISEKRLPQDGSFRINYFDKAQGNKYGLDFRVATCRASVGENVTIRILDSRKAMVGLENLHHSPHVLEKFKGFLKSPSGMILVCGPTGSGKSSTLYAALQYIYNPGIKIITVEDPIEYNFPGIMQTQVNPKINLTFSRYLRSFLRFDPDVILVGEMRDEETAKIGFDAAQTGHLLLSTLHTNDSINAIPRLLDLGVEYGQITSSLMCILAQRLVRKICPSCIEEYMPEEDEWGLLFKKYPTHLQFYKGRGCDACNHSGYSGRTLLSEIFAVDEEISKTLTKGYDEHQITRLATESGMKTMLDDGLMKLNETTIAEIIRMVPYEMIKSYRSRTRSQEEVDGLIEDLMGEEIKSTHNEDDAPGSFVICNPIAERPIIDLIQSKYERLLDTQNGERAGVVNSKLFKEFITENFNQIHAQTRCKSIEFNLQKNPATSRVDIFATPNQ